jgi:hypothetical protein
VLWFEAAADERQRDLKESLAAEDAMEAAVMAKEAASTPTGTEPGPGTARAASVLRLSLIALLSRHQLSVKEKLDDLQATRDRVLLKVATVEEIEDQKEAVKMVRGDVEAKYDLACAHLNDDVRNKLVEFVECINKATTTMELNILKENESILMKTMKGGPVHDFVSFCREWTRSSVAMTRKGKEKRR